MANAKAHKRLRPSEDVELSRFRAPTYKQSLLLALNWYNANVSDASLRRWTLEYVKEARPEVYEVLSRSSLPDYAFHHTGILAHLTGLDFDFRHGDEFKLDRYIDEIAAASDPKKTPRPEGKKSISLEDRLTAVAQTRCAELDAMVDAFITEGKPLDVRTFITINSAGGQIIARMRAHISGFLDDLRALTHHDRDPLLAEGYSNLPARVRKVLVEQLSVLFDASIKTTRRKPKSPAKVVKNITCLKNYPELGLTSIDPIKLVGAKEVWLYNVKTRVITVLRGPLGVVDRVIKGYDMGTSSRKKVRKPVKFFHRLGKERTSLQARYNKSKTHEQPVTSGRLGKSIVILGAFQ